MKTIYHAPTLYHEAGLDAAVLDAFGLTAPAPDLAAWHDIADRLKTPDGSVRIGIVGKYTQLEDAYKSISEALIHGAMFNRVSVKTEVD